MENKFVEFIKNNKKVIISSVAVGVVLVLGFGWYSYNQHQAEQQAKIVQLEKDSKSDKEQVDKLFESFDASSDESISKLKESSKAIVDFHLQKGLAYDIKDSDDKFKDKTTLENNVKEINKQIDFIKKVDETFKQEKLDETVKSLTDMTDKFQKQIDVLKKEEEQKASDKAKEDKKKEESNSSQVSNSSSSGNSDYAPGQSYTSGNSQAYSGSTGGDTSNYEAPAAEESSSSNGGNNDYTLYHISDQNGNHLGDFYRNSSNGDIRDTNGNHLGNAGGGIADFRQR